MKKITLLIGGLMIQCIWVSAQKVGVNTLTPLATFHVDLGDSLSNGILFTGLEPNGGSFPSLGAGRRFMFYPGKGALRAGVVEGNHWDNLQVGSASVAFGYNTIARGPGSFATGDGTKALGFISSTFGTGTLSKGYCSMVVGMFNDSIISTNEDAPTFATPLFIVGNGDGYGSRHNAMVVRKDGSVGIGTNEPANQLTVEGSANITGNLGIGLNTPTNKLSVYGNANFTGNACIGAWDPEASAQLDVTSTTKGFLPPRMSRTQRNEIGNLVAGLMIWCTTCGTIGEIQVFNGFSWTNMVGAVTNNIDTNICDQVWMLKNLDVSTYRDGTPIPNVTDPVIWSSLTTGAYCYFQNDSTTYAAVYGKLYNWYAVNDPKGLAPLGWHIPTYTELESLSTCLGGGLVAGGKLKETGTTHWLTPNTGATNISGFTGLPGGLRFAADGDFSQPGTGGYFWSNTAENSTNALVRNMSNDSAIFFIGSLPKKSGITVRCLRD